MADITITTVQGIGDLFWTYQKLAPYFGQIHYNVLRVDDGPIQERGRPFLAMLPKVGRISYQTVTPEKYQAVARKRYKLPAGSGAYAVNAALEEGVNLLDIDPGARVDQFVDLGLPATVEQGDYLCAFVAGEKAPSLWDAGKWAATIRTVAARIGTDKVALVGAGWDVPVQAEILGALPDLAVISYAGILDLAGTIGVIRGSRFFLGFQSGLSVIAENYNVRQLMVYYDALRPMLYTWSKPESIRTTFHAMTFSDELPAAL